MNTIITILWLLTWPINFYMFRPRVDKKRVWANSILCGIGIIIFMMELLFTHNKLSICCAGLIILVSGYGIAKALHRIEQAKLLANETKGL